MAKQIRQLEALLQEEQKTIQVIEQIAIEHGYEPDKQPLDAWLNDRLSMLEGLGDNAEESRTEGNVLKSRYCGHDPQ